MIIENNGLKINANVGNGVLTYQVEEQSRDAQKTLDFLGVLTDAESGFSLRSNKRPSYNKTLKRFFVRGSERDHHNDPVTVRFNSTAEATRALEALRRLVNNAVLPEAIDPQHKVEMRPMPGGTTACRMALITRDQAVKLNLTAKKFYPDERYWEYSKPIFTKNKHFSEHIAQIVDVLNKSLRENQQVTAGVVNPHRVTPIQARKAVEAVRALFDKAEAEDYLVALWRVVTGCRGPDFTDDD